MNSLLVLVLLGTSPALAGVCDTNQSAYDAVQQVEDIAANPKVKLVFPEYARCLPRAGRVDHKLTKRATKACETILNTNATHRACVDLAASHGQRKVGKADIEAVIAARPLDPWKLYSGHGGPEGDIDETYDYLARFGIRSATATVMDAWRDNLRVAAKYKPGSDKRHVWNEWRKIATRTLARLGGEPEREFLADQLPALKLEGNAALVELVEEAIEHLEP